MSTNLCLDAGSAHYAVEVWLPHKLSDESNVSMTNSLDGMSVNQINELEICILHEMLCIKMKRP